MKKTILAALAASVAALPLAAADVSGTWDISGDVAGNAVTVKCMLKQSAAAISGTCTSGSSSSFVKGSVNGDKVVFTHQVEYNGQLELDYSGTLDAAGSKISGGIEVPAYNVNGTFTAAKEASAPAPAAAKGPDVSGNWTITGEVAGRDITMKCALTQESPKVLGKCTYVGVGESPTTGTVDAGKLVLQNEVQVEALYSMTYTGALDAAGTAVKGDIAVAGVSGTFSGTKDK